MAAKGGGGPKPHEVFILPVPFISCLLTIAKKLEGSEVKWAVGGETSEIIQGVHVNPANIEIFTDKAGMEELVRRMADYNPSPVSMVERKLDRAASHEGKELPVVVRANQCKLVVDGVDVYAYSDYQFKVGDFEWGDTLEFEPAVVNVAGTIIPVMHSRIMSEIYLMLGWDDRVEMISDAVHRAHHALDFGF
jgi:hypothetical protein